MSELMLPLESFFVEYFPANSPARIPSIRTQTIVGNQDTAITKRCQNLFRLLAPIIIS